jgi:phosphoribosylamine---glycine ligase
MRFLGIGDSADLASLYLRLIEEGHEVKIFVRHPLCQGTLHGLVERVTDWKSQLGWVREAGDRGCILFENAEPRYAQEQDGLRSEGFNVIGGSAYGARLENDRAFAQAVIGGLGLQTAPSFEFDTAAAAEAFVEARPARYVLKYYASARPSFVGTHPAGKDVLAVLRANRDTLLRFILMDFIEGVEMGVGAYFNSTNFLAPACLDWEHKRFFPGDLGELTGEMGTIVTYERSKSFFARTLGKMELLLRENGYCGYINLNTIVNEEGIWPLEFTCRFGYPGYAILESLQAVSWGDLFATMLTQSRLQFETEPGFAAGIVITTPPFPYYRDVLPETIGMPVIFRGELSEFERSNIHYGEVGLNQEGDMVTTGMSGWTLVVTGRGPTIAQARDRANALADKVLVPNARFRHDIGTRLVGEFGKLEAWHVLD